MGIPLNEKNKKLQPKLSPNRRWMAYVSAESGRNEIYICSFPEMNKNRWQVTAVAETIRNGRKMAASCSIIRATQ